MAFLEESYLLDLMRREAARILDTKTFAKDAIITSYDPVRYMVKVAPLPEAVDENMTPLWETGWIPLRGMGIGPGWGIFVGPTEGAIISLLYLEGNEQTPIAIMEHSTTKYNFNSQNISVNPSEIVLVSPTGNYLKFAYQGTDLGVTLALGNGSGPSSIDIFALPSGCSINIVSDKDITMTSNNGQVNLTSTNSNININAQSGNVNVLSPTINLEGEVTIGTSSGGIAKATGTLTLGSNTSVNIGSIGGSFLQLLTSIFATWALAHVHGNGNGGADTSAPTTSPGTGYLTSILKGS